MTANSGFVDWRGVRMKLMLLCAAFTFATSSASSQTAATQNTPSVAVKRVEGWAAQQRRQAWATEKLAKSPRHSEWVTVPNGKRTLKAWIVYPNHVKGKVPVILLLHEVFGLTDSTRNTADQISALGYIVITPDLVSGYGPEGGSIDSFEPPYSASTTLTGLDDEAVNSDLNAWADFAANLPSSDGKFAVVGLSWGGGAAFRYATAAQRRDLKLVCVFYDVGPPAETQHNNPHAPASVSVASLRVPVYGFYPTKDTHVMASLKATEDAMAAAGKTFDPAIFQDADHAFMRLGEDPANTNPANVATVKASLARLENILKTM